MGIKKVVRKAKEALEIPFVYGHGDVGDVLVSFIKDECTEDQALFILEQLRQTYEDSLNDT